MSDNLVSNNQHIIDQTKCWIKSVVVENNFCPFAKRELDRGSVRYVVNDAVDTETALQAMIDECIYLDRDGVTETTLLIFGKGFQDFDDDYLRLTELGQALLVEQHYEGIYQLASFHPEYVFHGVAKDAAANYTNRSPYPMLHLIREISIEKALQKYPDPENIPDRNIKRANDLGLKEMKRKLQASYKING